jgi:multimeric flavodoxin WrbA
MKIALIHGQNHKGSTYHIARMTAEKISNEISEFFLPRDFSERCSGCFTCLYKGREFCPNADKVKIIFDAMLSSDVIIISSPTYLMEMSSHLKGFLEHIFTAWLGHRPEEAMFAKTAIVITTGAIIGMKRVTKSMANQMFYLGIPKTYQLPVSVMATSWKEVEDKTKEKIKKSTDKIASKIISKKGHVNTRLKTKLMFLILRLFHKSNNLAPFAFDKIYWENKNWTGKRRPWVSG